MLTETTYLVYLQQGPDSSSSLPPTLIGHRGPKILRGNIFQLFDRTRSGLWQPHVVFLSLILIAVANISAQGKSVTFAAFGDYGTSGSGEANVAAMVATWNPDFVITTGDNSYGSSSIDRNVGQFYSGYIGDYNGTYGSGADTNRFFPSAGNHDYSDGAGISAYLAYFTLPGDYISSSQSSGNELYYDFVWGPIHFFSINSNYQEPDGNSQTSVQAQWLRERLNLSTAQWKLVYFHHPPYSSSSRHGSELVMQWPFEDWGATAVLNGHDHTYERILRDDDNDGRFMPYFVTGLGGRSPYSFSPIPVEGSQVRYNSNLGAMLIRTDDSSINFSFYSISGGSSGTLIDSQTIIDSTALQAARLEIRPDTLYAYYANALEPLAGQIFIGDFRDGYSAADVIDTSVRVNEVLVPDRISSLASVEGFQGTVLQAVFSLTEFLSVYSPLWDTSPQTYRISGLFTDGSSFEVTSEATFVGHASGDFNLDGATDITDITLLASYLFRGGSPPLDPVVADFDHSNAIDIADLVGMIFTIYR